MIHKFQKVISVLFLATVLAIGFCTPSYAAGIPNNVVWRLTSFSPFGGRIVTDIPDRPITIKFDNQLTGAANGSGGCNPYFVSVAADCSEIKFTNIVPARAACEAFGENTVSSRENAYFDALYAVTKYSTDGTTLSLTNPVQEIKLEFKKS